MSKPIYRYDSSPKNPQNSLTPWTYLIHFIGESFLILAQVNLTKHTKFVQNKESQIIFSNMGKLRSLLATAAGGLALAGCTEAGTDKSNFPETKEPTKTELVKIATTEKTLTLLDCLKMQDQLEQETCELDVVARQKAEIAAKTAQRTENAIENAAKKDKRVQNAETILKNKEADKMRESIKAENNTRNDVLINRIANKAAQGEGQ